MEDRVHARPEFVLAVHDGIRKPPKGIDPQCILDGRAKLLVLLQESDDAVELVEECYGDVAARVLSVEEGRLTQFGVGSRVKPVADEMRARI